MAASSAAGGLADFAFIQHRATFLILQAHCSEILEKVPQTFDDNLAIEQKVRVVEGAVRVQPPDSLRAAFDIAAIPLRTTLQYFSLPYISEGVGYALPGSDRVREALIDTIHALVERSAQILLKVFDLEKNQTTVNDKSTSSSSQLALLTTPGKSILSEETKSALVRCIGCLFSAYKIAPGDTDILLNPQILPTLGFLVFRLLEIGATDRNRNLQTLAIETIHGICSRVHNADILANILPGVLLSLSKILTGDYKQGHKVFEAGFQMLATILVLTCADDLNPTLAPTTSLTAEGALSILKNFTSPPQSDASAAQVPKEDPPAPAERTFALKKRDASWYATSVPIIHATLRKIFSIGAFGDLDQPNAAPFVPSSIILDNWSVRLAMVECANSIASHCRRTLNDTTALLLEILVVHAYDDYPQIATVSQAALSKFSTAFVGDSPDTNAQATASQQLKPLLEANLEKLVSALPRIVREPDEKAKLLKIRLLGGYLRLLKDDLSVLVSVHLDRLAGALLQILEFEVGNIQTTKRSAFLLQSMDANFGPGSASASIGTEPSVSTQYSSQYVRKQFKFLKDDRALASLVSTIRFLGQHGDTMALIDYFVNVLRSQASVYTKQAIFVLNELLVGVSGVHLTSEERRTEKLARRARAKAKKTSKSQRSTRKPLPQLVDYLLEEYLAPAVWEFFKSPSADEESSLVGIELVNEHAILSALFLEGIGNFAQALGEDFNLKVRPQVSTLMHVLYPVISKLGEDNELVSTAAWSTLLRVAYYGGYKSVLDLVQANTDYLIDSLIRQMKYFRNYATSLRVLNGLLRHTGQAAVPLLKDVMDEVFSGLDLREPQYTISFLKVIYDAVVILEATTKKLRQSVQTPPKAPALPDIDTIRSLIDSGVKVDLKDFFARKLKARREKLAARVADDETTPEEFFTKYHEEKTVEKEEEVEEKGVSTGQVEDEEQQEAKANDPFFDVKKANAAHFDLVVQILKKCQHYTALKNVNGRILVLDIIAHAVEALALDSAKLLPAIHDIWDPLKHRFVDKDPRVLVKALEVMKVMASHSRDYLVRKFHDDLWPFIKEGVSLYNLHTKEGRRFLSRTGNRLGTQYSKQSDADSVFKTSASFITQRSALECLGVICENVPIMAADVRDIALSCWFYLSDTQPTEFQSSAVRLFRILKQNDPDFVWFELSELHPASNVELARKSTLILAEQHQNHQDTLRHFQRNVEQLLADGT